MLGLDPGSQTPATNQETAPADHVEKRLTSRSLARPAHQGNGDRFRAGFTGRLSGPRRSGAGSSGR
jgi:hypothetical protein